MLSHECRCVSKLQQQRQGSFPYIGWSFLQHAEVHIRSPHSQILDLTVSINGNCNYVRLSLVPWVLFSGLMARYALGALFNPVAGTVAGLQPAHFITLATPHFGWVITAPSYFSLHAVKLVNSTKLVWCVALHSSLEGLSSRP